MRTTLIPFIAEVDGKRRRLEVSGALWTVPDAVHQSQGQNLSKDEVSEPSHCSHLKSHQPQTHNPEQVEAPLSTHRSPFHRIPAFDSAGNAC
jgi:hypothetical protein